MISLVKLQSTLQDGEVLSGAKAFEWVGESDTQGNVYSHYCLGSFYYHGLGFDYINSEAFQ